MNSFVNGLNKTNTPARARTNNGAATLPTSGKPLVDFFNLAGASRGKNIIPVFSAAYNDNAELALRTALWARDVRQGAGERQVFRDILTHLEATDMDGLRKLLPRVPELGRWDDLLVLKGEGRPYAFELIRMGLFDDKFKDARGLVAKWMPRKGEDAVALRNYLGLSPKRYRKLLVSLTNVVEQQMCAKEWDKIVYDHVSSVAASRYRKAFWKNDKDRYASYVEELKKPVPVGEKPTRKINAGAIFPHDIIKKLNPFGRFYNGGLVSQVEKDAAIAQWNALPDFVGEGSFIPLIDVSGSMMGTPIEVSTALGIYCAERNKSAFKDVVLNFSDSPTIHKLTGDVTDKLSQVMKTNWGMSTNVEAAFTAILNHARRNNVAAVDMPQTLIILSDMEFNQCVRGANLTAYENAKKQYEAAGYELPKVVFWNLNGRVGNSPVKYTQEGTALVSGFSPAIMKTLLSSKNYSPLDIVLDTIMKDRYRLAV